MARTLAGTAQNPDPFWFNGYRYSEVHVPTEPYVAPAPAVARCECGSGSNVRSGAHSHWCPLWLAP